VRAFNRLAQGTLAKENQLIETFILHGTHPPFREGVEVGRLWWKFSVFQESKTAVFKHVSQSADWQNEPNSVARLSPHFWTCGGLPWVAIGTGAFREGLAQPPDSELKRLL